MPLPLDIRKKPVDVKVHVSSGAGVDITWSDAHTSHYAFPYLREHCPCATCREERDKKREVGARKDGSSSALPIFKPQVTARAASTVGGYAVQIEFTDGHSTGIYSFDHLREICPCEACGREFRAAQAQ